LQQHIQTLVDDNAQWQKLIADDLVWELTYAPSLGHPARLSGREEAVRHATWFVGAVENFHFFNLAVHAFADPEGAVAEVKGEGISAYALITGRWCSSPNPNSGLTTLPSSARISASSFP
jgi:hypothetical protein